MVTSKVDHKVLLT